jgi:multiple inositol-polyphosphate phosphatase/2,3-bisphosphoglycerate 3-phosphatase
VKNYNSGKSTLCPEDFALLRDWKLNTNFSPEKAELLALSGWNEVQNIASRYQKAFPSLLPTTYDRTKYQFRHTGIQRTEASFKAFADGLFGLNGYQKVTIEPNPARDLFLRVRAYSR